MVRTYSFIMILICFITGFRLDCQARSEQPIKRMVLAIGANLGGPDRIPLQYAVSDAQTFSEVITEMGGVLPEDRYFLRNPGREAIIRQLIDFQRKIDLARPKHEKVEVILYYSGHSDQSHLLFKEDKLSYRELRSHIDRMNADVRITILDSCASGAITRIKGGKKRAPFLFDSAYNMKGYAFITSSSADEAAQESDQIKASFFTHHLVSGLRGAADLSQDGKVTLSEAYQYAFQETLQQTQNTQRGPQHPNYNIEMSGTGDVIMTDIRKCSVILAFAKSIQGRIFIYDQDENLVVELNKPGGRPIEIGLSAGRYRIANIREDALYATSIQLTDESPQTITPEMLIPQKREPTRPRGPELPAADTEPVIRADQPVRAIPFRLSLIDFPQNGRDDSRLKFALSLVSTAAGELDGLSISSGASLFQRDVKGLQIATVFTKAGRLRGVQVAVGANFSFDHAVGAQISSGFNFAPSIKGFQISSGANVIKEKLDGAQISAGFNIARDVSGAQVSAGMNISRSIHGLQLANINLAREVSGLQLGVVNIAGTVKGTQLGVVNIAKKNEGGSFGVLNIVGNGFLQTRFEIDELGFSSIGLRHGNKRFFSSYFIGSNLSFRQGLTGMSLGVILTNGKWIETNLEIMGKTIYAENRMFRETGLLGSLKASAAVHLLPRIDLFVGSSLNFFHKLGNSALTIPEPFYQTPWYGWTDGIKTHRFWIGVSTGLQFRII